MVNCGKENNPATRNPIHPPPIGLKCLHARPVILPRPRGGWQVGEGEAGGCQGLHHGRAQQGTHQP